MKCFVSHRSPSREGESVGRAKKKEWTHEGFWVPVKVEMLSTWSFRSNQMVKQEQDYQMSKEATKTKYR